MKHCPPWLTSPFRPFFLLGPLFGVLLALTWVAVYLGLLDPGASTLPLPLWHGHEMLFGFAAAMVSGFVLTALPGWAGTRELCGTRLALLVALWLAGRVVFWAAPWLPWLLIAVVDGSYFLVLGWLLVPELLALKERLYLWVVPIFAGFFVGNVLFHTGLVLGEAAWSGWGLRLALYALLLLFSFVGGLLTPIFTGNELRLRGDAAPAFSRPLEWLAVVTVLLYAATDLAGMDAAWCGAAALLAFVVHTLRMVRWRTGAILDTPILWVMHLGYAWLLVAFALRAASDLTGHLPSGLALHAFTVGAFGTMKLGLMTRVALRHTGRAVMPAQLLVWAFVAMSAAALCRIIAPFSGVVTVWLAVSALIWAACLALYLVFQGRMLIMPSLPRVGEVQT